MAELEELPDDVLIPCEFCDEVFPWREIIQHQSFCRADLLHYPSAENTDALVSHSAQNNQVLKNEVVTVANTNKVSKEIKKEEDFIVSREARTREPSAACIKFNTDEFVDEAEPERISNEFEEHVPVTLSSMHITENTSDNDEHISESVNEIDTDISEDNSDTETIESFLKGASVVLKKRLEIIKMGQVRAQDISKKERNTQFKWKKSNVS